MAKKSKFRGFAVLMVVGLVVCVAAGAVAFYVAQRMQDKPEPAQAKGAVTKAPVGTLISERKKVTVFLPKRGGEDGYYLAPVMVMADTKGSILDRAANALLATNKEGGDAANLIPKGTKLLSPIEVRSGVATVNLSKEFAANFAGGSDQEALTLNSIAQTLVFNSAGKADKARILVEGEALETLGGHYELTDPIEPDAAKLKPGKGD